MTIRRSIDAAALNRQLSNLEDCARNAPEGTYDEAKAAAEAISEIADSIMHKLSEAGFKVAGDDRMREIEAVIYGYLRDCNPEAYGLVTGEGFGEHVTGPRGAELIARAAANRDFLRNALSK